MYEVSVSDEKRSTDHVPKELIPEMVQPVSGTVYNGFIRGYCRMTVKSMNATEPCGAGHVQDYLDKRKNLHGRRDGGFYHGCVGWDWPWNWQSYIIYNPPGERFGGMM